MENSANNSENNKVQAWSFLFSELCFVLLPFLAILLVKLYNGHFDAIWKEPEWSLASSVMFGQSIIKLIHAGGKFEYTYTYLLGMYISLIILLGLMPSITLLTLIINSESIKTWVLVLQLCMFGGAIVVFSIVNYVLANGDLEKSKNEQVTDNE